MAANMFTDVYNILNILNLSVRRYFNVSRVLDIRHILTNV